MAVALGASSLIASTAQAASSPYAGLWTLDPVEGTWPGGVVADTSGGGRHGLARNGAASVGTWASFPNTPGCTDCAVIEAPGELGLGGAKALTVEAWVRWAEDPVSGAPLPVLVANASTQTPVVTALTPDAGQFWLRVAGDNAPVYQFGVRVGQFNVFVGGMTAPRKGVWTHVAGVYDGKQAMLFVSGVLEGTTAITGVVAPTRPEYRLTIGAASALEGNGIGRRGFAGDLDEVRVTATALDPAALRATACIAGPQAALAGLCGELGALCSDCQDLTLVAKRWYSPARTLDGVLDLCRPVRVAIPATLSVTSGSAAGGDATLSWKASATGDGASCRYVPDASGALRLDACSDGAPVGRVVAADHLELRVGNGKADAGPTRVTVSLAEVGAPTDIQVLGVTDGMTVATAVDIGVTVSGAPAGTTPTMRLNDAPLPVTRPLHVQTEGAHVLTVTAGSCHRADAQRVVRFTIDRTPPTVALRGVPASGRVVGPLDLDFAVQDALSDVTLVVTLNGAPVSLPKRLTQVGDYTLVVTATDDAGNRAVREYGLHLVEAVGGVVEDVPLETLCNLSAPPPGLESACREICARASEQEQITPELCEDRDWLSSWCGRIEQEKWSAAAAVETAAGNGAMPDASKSVCAFLKFQLPTPGAPGTGRLLPETLVDALGGTTTHIREHDDRPTILVKVPQTGVTHIGGASTFQGARRHDAVRKAFAGAAVSGPAPISDAKRAIWEANKNQVMDCEEYTFEKFYNFSAYEDEVARHGADYRAYVDVAFEAPKVLTLPSAGQDMADDGYGTRWAMSNVAGGLAAIALGGTAAIQPTSPQGVFASSANLRFWEANTVKLPAPYAIGTILLSGDVLRARNGTVLPGALGNFEERQPHELNPFFTFETWTLAQRQEADPTAPTDVPEMFFNARLDDYQANHMSAAHKAAYACPGGAPRPTGLGFVGLCDDGLRNTIHEGHQVHVDRTMAYHKARRDLAAKNKWTDEDLYATDRLKERLVQLGEERSRIVAAILANWSEPPEAVTAPPVFENPLDIHSNPADLVLSAQYDEQMGNNGAALFTAPPTQLVGGMALDLFLDQNVGAGITPLSNHVQLPATRAPNSSSPLATAMPSAALRMGKGVPGFVVASGYATRVALTEAELLGTTNDLFTRLLRTDRLIEEVLHEAQTYGCIDTWSEGTICDWSPRDFALLVKGAYAGQQEGAYQRCVEHTAVVGFDKLSAGYALKLRDTEAPHTPGAGPRAVHYGGGTHQYGPVTVTHIGSVQLFKPLVVPGGTEEWDAFPAIGVTYAPPGKASDFYVFPQRIRPGGRRWTRASAGGLRAASTVRTATATRRPRMASRTSSRRPRACWGPTGSSWTTPSRCWTGSPRWAGCGTPRRRATTSGLATPTRWTPTSTVRTTGAR